MYRLYKALYEENEFESLVTQEKLVGWAKTYALPIATLVVLIRKLLPGFRAWWRYQNKNTKEDIKQDMFNTWIEAQLMKLKKQEKSQ